MLMHRIRKRLTIGAGVLCGLTVLFFSAQLTVTHLIKQALNKEFPEYRLTAADVDCSLLRRSVTLQQVEILPRDRAAYSISIRECGLTFTGATLWKLVKNALNPGKTSFMTDHMQLTDCVIRNTAQSLKIPKTELRGVRLRLMEGGIRPEFSIRELTAEQPEYTAAIFPDCSLRVQSVSLSELAGRNIDRITLAAPAITTPREPLAACDTIILQGIHLPPLSFRTLPEQVNSASKEVLTRIFRELFQGEKPLVEHASLSALCIAPFLGGPHTCPAITLEWPSTRPQSIKFSVERYILPVADATALSGISFPDLKTITLSIQISSTEKREGGNSFSTQRLTVHSPGLINGEADITVRSPLPEYGENKTAGDTCRAEVTEFTAYWRDEGLLPCLLGSTAENPATIVQKNIQETSLPPALQQKLLQNLQAFLEYSGVLSFHLRKPVSLEQLLTLAISAEAVELRTAPGKIPVAEQVKKLFHRTGDFEGGGL